MATALIAAPAGAGAAVTLGETFVPNIGNTCNGGPDWEVVQTARASGRSYAAPLNGVLTSWSFQAGLQETVLTLRVFRPTGTAHQYQVIGDASELKTVAASSGLHTFPTQIAVQAGDLIGIRSTTGACASFTGNDGDTYDFNFGTATGVGALGDFEDGSEFIEDISAVLEPTNSIALGAIQRNKKKGTATLNLTLPNPGELTGSGNGVKAASTRVTISKSVTAGAAQLMIKASGKKKKKLNANGKVKLNVAVTFTPKFGGPNTQSVKVKLKKKLKKSAR
jgi:hypothetical protein